MKVFSVSKLPANWQALCLLAFGAVVAGDHAFAGMATWQEPIHDSGSSLIQSEYPNPGEEDLQYFRVYSIKDPARLAKGGNIHVKQIHVNETGNGLAKALVQCLRDGVQRKGMFGPSFRDELMVYSTLSRISFDTSRTEFPGGSRVSYEADSQNLSVALQDPQLSGLDKAAFCSQSNPVFRDIVKQLRLNVANLQAVSDKPKAETAGEKAGVTPASCIGPATSGLKLNVGNQLAEVISPRVPVARAISAGYTPARAPAEITHALASSSILVDIKQVDPSIVVKAVYATNENFVGHPLPGYKEQRCLVTRDAAIALKAAQARLRAKGYGLILYDCYRPKDAVDYLSHGWAGEPGQSQRSKYYPSMSKQEILRRGFISGDSDHSRGSTVDVSLVRLKWGKPYEEVDMGTPVDFFGSGSHTDAQMITGDPGRDRQVIRNRSLLHFSLGPDFDGKTGEWWHFNLRNPAYQGDALNVPV